MLQLLYWFLPAYVANAAPPLLAKLFPGWTLPVDLGRTWRGKRLLGANKTWRGVIGGSLLAAAVFLIQKHALAGIIATPSIPYASLPWSYGLLMGVGTLVVGDCGESLVKRRLGVRPGRPFAPWDQLDYTLGALLAVGWLWWPGWLAALGLLAFNGLLSAGSHWLGWRLGVNKDRF